MRQSLEARPNDIKIAFIDRVKPSNLPDRLTPWMTTLRNAGGELKVVPPAGELQARGLPLLSLIPTLWTIFSAVKTDQPQTSLLEGYDAQILLKIDASGDRLVDSIVFKKR